MSFPLPRYATKPDPDALTLGPKVAAVANVLGTPLMPWQRLVADTALEIDPDTGTFRYSRVVVTVPRQSGKTTLLRALFVHRCLTMQNASCWLTAQHRNDARDIWSDIAKSVDRSALSPLVKIRRTNGSESVSWPLGGEIRIFAPAEDSLHGKTTTLVGVDEVWAFNARQGMELIQAIVPSQATIAGAQTWLVSTAGSARSTWLRSLVDSCRNALSRGDEAPAAYFEWSIPDDADLEDLQPYQENHPALGHTISEDALVRARQAMSSADFARAYGNFWVSTADFVISPTLWVRSATIEPILKASPVAFAVEVSVDRSEAVIVAAGYVADKIRAVEIVKHNTGVGWITEKLLDMISRHRPVAVVIDPRGPGRTVLAELREQRKVRIPLLDFGTGDLVAAHSEFLDGITDGSVRHRPDAGGLFDKALGAASVRKLQEQDALSRRLSGDGVSPAPLIAAQLALYGLKHPGIQDPRPGITTTSPKD